MNTRFGDYTVHPSANPIDEPPDTITQENITYTQYRDMQGAGTVQNSGGMKNRAHHHCTHREQQYLQHNFPYGHFKSPRCFLHQEESWN